MRLQHSDSEGKDVTEEFSKSRKLFIEKITKNIAKIKKKEIEVTIQDDLENPETTSPRKGRGGK